jgi:hypothetical protein
MARKSFPHHHHQQQSPIKKMSPSLSGLPVFAGLPRCGYRRGKYKKKKHCSTVFVSRLGDVDVVRHIDFLRSGFDLEGWLRRRRP